MEANQPTPAAVPVTSGNRSSFWPGSISFLAGVLLFLLPFVDIKCGDATLKEVRGFELATGFTVEDKSMNQSIFGNMGMDQTTKTNKSEKRDPDMFALAALGLGILGFVISFLVKGRSVLAAFIGTLATVSLIIMMINIKGDSKLNTGSKANNNLDGFGSNLGNDIIRVEFTPWLYITIILFLAAAFFCWRKKTIITETTNAKTPDVENPGG